MRLLNAHTFLFREFLDDAIPRYAILSHTWGNDEITYKDWIATTISSSAQHRDQVRLEVGANGLVASLRGLQKILDWCRFAKEEGFEWVWIDTCCIDKSSSVELSEAINSMFRWYQDATLCYAYLSDVNSEEDPSEENSSFRRSRWFTRGWTLQELIAPNDVVFLASDWKEIGTRHSLVETVSAVTKIPEVVLISPESQSKYSHAQRMFWASGRITSRTEDQAYCLLGLFGVNMPLLYGEKHNAFLRLQQIILNGSTECTLLAWEGLDRDEPVPPHLGPSIVAPTPRRTGLLATSPYFFRNSGDFKVLSHETRMNRTGASWSKVRVAELTTTISGRLHGPLELDSRGSARQEDLISKLVSTSVTSSERNHGGSSVSLRAHMHTWANQRPRAQDDAPRVFLFLVASRKTPCDSPGCYSETDIGILLVGSNRYMRLNDPPFVQLDPMFSVNACEHDTKWDLSEQLRNWPSTQLDAVTRDTRTYLANNDVADNPSTLVMSLPKGVRVKFFRQTGKVNQSTNKESKPRFEKQPLDLPFSIANTEVVALEFTQLSPRVPVFTVVLSGHTPASVFQKACNEITDQDLTGGWITIGAGDNFLELADGLSANIKRRGGDKGYVYHISL